MSYGDGQIIFTNNPAKSGGGSVTDADNGLNLSGTTVEMGGALIKDVQIPSDGFSWRISDDGGSNQAITFLPSGNIIGIGGEEGTGGVQIEINATARNIFFLDWEAGINKTFLFFDHGNQVYQFGDLDLDAGGMIAEMDSTNAEKNFVISQYGYYQLNIDPFNQLYAIGDIGAQANNNYLQIDDANNLITLGKSVSIFQNDTANKKLEYFPDGDAVYQLLLSPNIALLGRDDDLNIRVDQGGSGNGIRFYIGSDEFLEMQPNVSGSYYLIGAFPTDKASLLINDDIINLGDYGGVNFGYQLQIDTTNETFTVLDYTNNYNYFIVDTAGIHTQEPADDTTNGPAWRLGDVVTAASTFNATKYIQVSLNGTLYKLALAT